MVESRDSGFRSRGEAESRGPVRTYLPYHTLTCRQPQAFQLNPFSGKSTRNNKRRKEKLFFFFFPVILAFIGVKYFGFQ